MFLWMLSVECCLVSPLLRLCARARRILSRIFCFGAPSRCRLLSLGHFARSEPNYPVLSVCIQVGTLATFFTINDPDDKAVQKLSANGVNVG